MTYNTASGVPIPQGTDAFNPPAQFRDWADGDDIFNNLLNVNLDSERTALAPPKLRDGIFCWVRGTKTLWSYQGTTWAVIWSSGTPFAMAAGSADILQSGTVVNFPAGRFTVPPIVTVAGGWVSASGAVGNPIIVKYAELLTTRVTLLSTTAATVRGFWTAVQMTPTSAEG